MIERWAQAAVESAVGGVGEELAAAVDCRVFGVGYGAAFAPLLHLAEGQLSREVLAKAAGQAGLAVHCLPPKGPHDPVHVECAGMGRDPGHPWRKEHKLAAAAALMVLSARSC